MSNSHLVQKQMSHLKVQHRYKTGIIIDDVKYINLRDGIVQQLRDNMNKKFFDILINSLKKG